MTSERSIRNAQIRAELADEGKDPKRYEIVWDDDETLEDYHLRRLDDDEIALRRREELADAEEFLTKALREFGYDREEILEMDVVEMAETFSEEYARQGGGPR